MEDKIRLIDRAVEKVGGAFKLTVLLQKRVRELIKGSPPLVLVTPDMGPIDVALHEVLENKIKLVEDSEAKEKPVKIAAPQSGPKAEKEKKEKKSKKKK